MSSLHKRKKMKKKKEKKSLLLSLPDELLITCIARVSRLYHPTLSRVCKRFQSLIASPELYKVRSLLNLTESCLYVCLRYTYGYRMYTLCRNPNLLDDTKKSSEYALATVPVPHCTWSDDDDLVSVGSDVYKISKSSKVLSLDCGTHTWREAPSLPAKKKVHMLSACVVDQKIYVSGTYEVDKNHYNFIYVLDTKSQIWNRMTIPRSKIESGVSVYLRSACIDQKIHLDNGCEKVVYDSNEGRWDFYVTPPDEGHFTFYSYCEIENVTYCGLHGMLKWFDSEERMWRKLEGLVGFPELRPNARVRLAEYGGKMAVFWVNDWVSSSGFEIMVWCGVIGLEKCTKSGEILGKVEWVDHVLSVPNPLQFWGLVKALTVTV